MDDKRGVGRGKLARMRTVVMVFLRVMASDDWSLCELVASIIVNGAPCFLRWPEKHPLIRRRLREYSRRWLLFGVHLKLCRNL